MTVYQITAPPCPVEGERRVCFSVHLFSSREPEQHKDRNDLANRKRFITFHHIFNVSAFCKIDLPRQLLGHANPTDISASLSGCWEIRLFTCASLWFSEKLLLIMSVTPGASQSELRLQDCRLALTQRETPHINTIYLCSCIFNSISFKGDIS